MYNRNRTAGLQNREDHRVFRTIVSFVYAPLALLLGAAAIIGAV